MNSDRPRCPSAGSGRVRATTRITSARPAQVHQVLAPVSNQPPSQAVARSFRPATSEPKSGSVIEMATSLSPDASRGSQATAGRPCRRASSARAMISGRVIRLPAAPSDDCRQRLGHDQHREGVRMIVRLQPAEALRDRDAEQAEPGGALDDVLRDVGVAAMDRLRARRDHLGPELQEGVAHQVLLVTQSR